MNKYRKKPIVIEARELTLDSIKEILNWCGDKAEPLVWTAGGPCLFIKTLEGNMWAYIGDWIIKGIKGEFYPCKREIFEASYERAED